jgi:hypothetical protein
MSRRKEHETVLWIKNLHAYSVERKMEVFV